MRRGDAALQRLRTQTSDWFNDDRFWRRIELRCLQEQMRRGPHTTLLSAHIRRLNAALASGTIQG